MKKSVVMVCLAVVALAFASVAQAVVDCPVSRGKAIVPNVIGRYKNIDNYTVTHIVVSNITSSDVDCKITVYNHDGVDVTSWSKLSTGTDTSLLNVIAQGTGEFTLPAQSTRIFTFGTVDGQQLHYPGYATIEWASDDSTMFEALVAGGRMWHESGGNPFAIGFLVNGGMPF